MGFTLLKVETLNFQSTLFNITIESESAVHLYNLFLPQVSAICWKFGSKVPLKRILFRDEGGGEFIYRIVSNEIPERRWVNRFYNMPSLDPPMTFNVSDPWKQSEFSLQRNLRDLFIEETIDKKIKKIDIVWN